MTIERSADPKLFFSKKETALIIKTIQEAELKTSGEIRIHLERKIKGDPLDHAKRIFEKIGMTQTKDANGVLILFGVKSRRFVILGDTGINEKVPPHFWDDVVRLFQEHFKEDRFADGLVEGIKLIGQKLRESRVFI